MASVQDVANQLPLFSDTIEPDPTSGFSVRESARAKRLSIKVFPRGRVEVVVPRRTQAVEVQRFVESQRDWIRRAKAQFAAEHTPEPFVLPRRVRLDGIGRDFGIEYRPLVNDKRVRYKVSGNTVTLSGHTADERLCVAALKRWLIALAKREYVTPLNALASMTGNSYKKMHVRGQRTCWGSHSSSGTISLNYCLMFLDPAQLRYVMIHELCHARHMNHSQRFWNLVGRYEKSYRQLDKELSSCWMKIPTWVGIY